MDGNAAEAPPEIGKTERFDPTRYLTKMGDKDYLEVKWRLVWLRDKHPNAGIDSTLVMHEPGHSAVFVTKVTLPTGGYATGWGSETAADFRDYLEKAETKSVGRALAALGYGTQHVDDFDFSAGAHREKVVDAPVGFPPGRRPAGAPGEEFTRARAEARGEERGVAGLDPPPGQGVTARQIRFLEALGREIDVDPHAEARAVYGGRGISELGRREASELIERLQTRRTAAAGPDGRGGRAGSEDPPGWPAPKEWGRWLRLISRAEDAHAVETIRDAYVALAAPEVDRRVMDAIESMLATPERFSRLEPHDVAAV